jgi:soluble lytic murein transglycosylase-like protein
MDGTAAIALIIIILFFSSYTGSKGTSKPQPVSSAKTDTYSSAAGTASADNVFPPKQETATPDSENAYYVYMDKTPVIYQFVEYDRMDLLIKKYNKNLSQSEADRIKIAVNKYCKEKDLDPRIILAIMARESGFKPDSVSPSGAMGLGQILPLNYEQLGITDPHDIDQNTKGVVYYFKEKLDDWKGSPNQLGLAVASYLKGTGEIKRAGGKYDGHTETYVNDILRIRSGI